MAVIQRVAAALNEVSGEVVVNGYTDNQPIRTARYPSNWHLSQERAQAVSAMLQRSITDGVTALLAVATAAVLWKFKKLPEPVVVLAAALAGLLLYPLAHPA